MPKPIRKDLKGIRSKNYTIGFQKLEKEVFESLLEQIYGPNPGSNPPDPNEPNALVIYYSSEPPIVPWP